MLRSTAYLATEGKTGDKTDQARPDRIININSEETELNSKNYLMEQFCQIICQVIGPIHPYISYIYLT